MQVFKSSNKVQTFHDINTTTTTIINLDKASGYVGETDGIHAVVSNNFFGAKYSSLECYDRSKCHLVQEKHFWACSKARFSHTEL